MNIRIILPRTWLHLVFIILIAFAVYGEPNDTAGGASSASQGTNQEEKVIRSLNDIDTLPVATFYQGIIKNLIQTNLARYSSHQTFSNYMAGTALAVKSILHPASKVEEGISISIILLPGAKLQVEESKVLEIVEGILIQVQNTMGYFGLRFDLESIGGKLIVQRPDENNPQIEELKLWIERLTTRKNLTLIATELIRMAGIEMEIKGGMRSVDEKLSITHVNTLKSIIKMIGWPTPQKVGVQASHASWLIALQADFDREFQKEVLALITNENSIDPTELAFLSDRIRILDGQKQIYGTQYEVNKEGNIVPLPIEEFEKVDERRNKIGLEPFSKYLENLYESVGKRNNK